MTPRLGAHRKPAISHALDAAGTDRPPSACGRRRCRCRPRRRCRRCTCARPRPARTVRHLMPVGKPAPPRPRRPEVDDLLQQCVAAPSARARARPAMPPCAQIVVQRQRIDDADAREGQALLARHPRHLLGQAERQRMRARRRGTRRRTAIRTSPGRDRAIGDTAVGRLHLDQRLQPQHAARAGAHDASDRRPSRRGVVGDGASRRGRRRPTAPRHRGRRRRSRSCDAPARATSASARVLVESGRAARRPPGPPARARNCRGNRRFSASTRPRAWRPGCKPCAAARCAATRSTPLAWQASARQSFSTCRPGTASSEVMVETDHAAHLGLRDVQRARPSAGTACAGTWPKAVLQRVQDRQHGGGARRRRRRRSRARAAISAVIRSWASRVLQGAAAGIRGPPRRVAR